MKKLYGKENFVSVTEFKLGAHLSALGCCIFK